MTRTTGVSLLALCLLASPARADGLIRSLPEDGRWVKFHGVLKFDTSESNGDVILRSVGTEQVDGKPARWIELVMGLEEADQKIYKLLVREEHLRAGVDPIDHIVRAWEKSGDEEAVRLEKPQRLDYSFVGAMLHAPVKGAEKTAEREFPWQRGTIKTHGHAGARELADEGGVKGKLEATYWPSKEVPFGVAGLKVVVTPAGSNTTIQLELVVTDFGKDAKSALPDAK